MKSFVWIRYELKNMLADVKVVGLLFIVPLLLLFLFGYVLAPYFKEESQFEKIDLALINQDNSQETQMMIQHFLNNEYVKRSVRLTQLHEEGARQMLADDKVSAVIIIPEGFSRDIERGINTPVTVLGNPARPLQAALVRTLMESGADMVTAAQSGVNTIYTYMARAGVSQEELQSAFRESVLQFTLQTLNRQEMWEKTSVSLYGDVSMQQYYLVTIGIIFVLCSGLVGVRMGTSDSRLLERRLRSQGIGSFQFVIVRWITLSIFVAIPYFYYFGILAWMMRASYQGEISYLLIMSLVFPLTVSALFTTVFTCLKNMATINLASFVLIIGMSVVGGTIIPLAYLPLWVEKFQYISLNYWLAQAIFSSFFNGDGFWTSLIVLNVCFISLLSITVTLQQRRVV